MKEVRHSPRSRTRRVVLVMSREKSASRKMEWVSPLSEAAEISRMRAEKSHGTAEHSTTLSSYLNEMSNEFLEDLQNQAKTSKELWQKEGKGLLTEH